MGEMSQTWQSDPQLSKFLRSQRLKRLVLIPLDSGYLVVYRDHVRGKKETM